MVQSKGERNTVNNELTINEFLYYQEQGDSTNGSLLV